MGYKTLGSIVFALSLIVFISSSCIVNDDDKNSAEYDKTVFESRQKKDSTFKAPADGERSPIADEDRVNFKGLKYFPINISYRLEAILERAEDAEDFEMKTSTERLPVYRKYGDLKFHFNKKEFSLEIYQNVDLISREGYEDYLFLPFTDETSGEECYGGGRYIDLKIPAGDTLIVDFNYAYNPYCNYSDNYSCPVPPPQNHIPVRIEAGELNYH